MHQANIRSLVAIIAIFGHLGAILVGVWLLVLNGPYGASEGIQMVLISSPVIAVLAGAGLRHIMGTGTDKRKGKKVNTSFAIVAISIPIILISCIISLFFVSYRMIGELSLNDIKSMIGGIEVIFGVYVGTISDTLFGKLKSTEQT